MVANWFDTKMTKTRWLIDGLLAYGTHSSLVGKPRAGKSSFARALIAAVIKGDTFLGRRVFVPKEGGRVLYLHLERKDPTEQVAEDLRRLGITKEESARLLLLDAQDMLKETKEESSARTPWLMNRISLFKPDLVVIDVLLQFVDVLDCNSYNEVLKRLNALQDALHKIKFKGHLLTTHHARKSSSAETFDNLLGSTGLRASFQTNVMLREDKETRTHTIQSDQTVRSDQFGEIEETFLERDPATGRVSLGRTVADVRAEQAQANTKDRSHEVLNLIARHPRRTHEDIETTLSMSPKVRVRVLKALESSLSREGTGRTGDPFRYSLNTEAVIEA